MMLARKKKKTDKIPVDVQVDLYIENQVLPSYEQYTRIDLEFSVLKKTSAFKPKKVLKKIVRQVAVGRNAMIKIESNWIFIMKKFADAPYWLMGQPYFKELIRHEYFEKIN
eukprot:snap_masked-scaffold_45-processed-gene-0.50-mRNA-1 protein AED:1.00 eAED:1.00 QI:0/-1/0/0/-1/1/1/0/110